MQITIDDNLSGKERKKMMSVYSIMYAFALKRTQPEVAKWLGISQRTVRVYLKKYDELKEYRGKGQGYLYKKIDDFTPKQKQEFERLLNHKRSTSEWRYLSSSEKMAYKKKLIRTMLDLY